MTSDTRSKLLPSLVPKPDRCDWLWCLTAVDPPPRATADLRSALAGATRGAGVR